MKSHNMLPKGNKQTQEVGASQGTSPPPIQFIEDPTIDWTFDDSFCGRLKTSKLKCENICKAELLAFQIQENANSFSHGQVTKA